MLAQTAIRSGSFKNPITRDPRPIGNHELTGAIELMGAPMSFLRNAEIYGESEPADYLYKVVSGIVRTYKSLANGRRQIGGFYLPGDIFGLEAGDEHAFSAEAITESKVLGSGAARCSRLPDGTPASLVSSGCSPAASCGELRTTFSC